MSYRYDCREASGRGHFLGAAVTSLAAAELVVFPTDAVYGLGCDAFSRAAVATMFAARGSGRGQPPPVLIPHLRTLDGIATAVSASARELAEAFWPGGLTLICRAQPSLDWDLGDAHGTVSVRMPLHPVALELLERVGPMAVTSAAIAGNPAPVDCDAAQQALGDAVAVYLDAGPMTGPQRSTIVDATGDRLRVLRLGAVGLAELRAVVGDLEAPAGERAQPPPASEPAQPPASEPDRAAPNDAAPDGTAPNDTVPDGMGPNDLPGNHAGDRAVPAELLRGGGHGHDREGTA